MTLYFNPFGAKVWNIITLGGDHDVGLYCSGRRNSFGTALAARGSRAEIEALARDSLLM